MEDILASIRRILSEDEAPAAGAGPPTAPPAGDGVLVLDPAMMRNGHRVVGNAWRRMRLAGSDVTV